MGSTDELYIKLVEYNFCTIITFSHLHYAKALLESLQLQKRRVLLHVLIVDKEFYCEEISGLKYYSLKNLQGYETNNLIIDKYQGKQDNLRWSLKPGFLKYLLLQNIFGLYYCDCDINFFNDFSFLFKLLDSYNVVLSPHNRSLNPFKDENNFVKNFTEGIYNAGFVGVSHGGIPTLDYWADACLHECIKDTKHGYYVDQKYLDLVPARFKKVHSLQHYGCNLAGWNLIDCKRGTETGDVLINERYPVIFIHFVAGTCELILLGPDKLLLPYLETYALRLQRLNPSENLINKIIKQHDENYRRKLPWYIRLRIVMSMIKNKYLSKLLNV